MPLTLAVYDWRPALEPVSQVFRAGAVATAGGMTLGGAAQYNPEPGGRAELLLDFAPQASPEANRAASWTYSRIMAGSVFKVRLWESLQLLGSAEIFGAASEYTLTAALSPADPATDGSPIWDPKLAVSASASAGAVQVTVAMAGLAPVLEIGHVVGFRSGAYDFAHIIEAISYTGESATITVSPPLRRALTTSNFCHLRPAMMAVCANPGEVAAQFQRGIWTQPGSFRFVEALV